MGAPLRVLMVDDSTEDALLPRARRSGGPHLSAVN